VGVQKKPRVAVLESIMGLIALDEEKRIVGVSSFPKDPQQIAERLRSLESGDLVEELTGLVEKLKGEGVLLVFENSPLALKVSREFGVEVEVQTPTPQGEHLRENLGRIAVELGFARDEAEAFEIMREVSTIIAKSRVREAAGRRDLVVVQMIRSIDELDKTINLIAGRIGEWYGLHFPEAASIIASMELRAQIVAELGGREDLTVEGLVEVGVPRDKAAKLVDAAETSMGAPMAAEDMENLRALCRLYLDSVRLRRSFADAVESIMEQVAPNVRAVAGPNLGARLIALAGGLDKLARFPASTIQVLGAEKALFRSLRTGTRPPKHGIIFQHHLIHPAPRWQRGKLARALASKIAIAARVDNFSGRDAGTSLAQEFEERAKEIREKYRAPPPRPERRHKGKVKGRKA